MLSEKMVICCLCAFGVKLSELRTSGISKDGGPRTQGVRPFANIGHPSLLSPSVCQFQRIFLMLLVTLTTCFIKLEMPLAQSAPTKSVQSDMTTQYSLADGSQHYCNKILKKSHRSVSTLQEVAALNRCNKMHFCFTLSSLHSS